MIFVMKGMLYWIGFCFFCDVFNVFCYFKSLCFFLVFEIILIFKKVYILFYLVFLNEYFERFFLKFIWYSVVENEFNDFVYKYGGC